MVGLSGPDFGTRGLTLCERLRSEPLVSSAEGHRCRPALPCSFLESSDEGSGDLDELRRGLAPKFLLRLAAASETPRGGDLGGDPLCDSPLALVVLLIRPPDGDVMLLGFLDRRLGLLVELPGDFSASVVSSRESFEIRGESL
jgi:hypothetical protein